MSDHNDAGSYDEYSINRYTEDSVNANPEYTYSTADEVVDAHIYTMSSYLHGYEAGASGDKK